MKRRGARVDELRVKLISHEQCLEVSKLIYSQIHYNLDKKRYLLYLIEILSSIRKVGRVIIKTKFAEVSNVNLGKIPSVKSKVLQKLFDLLG